MQDALAFTVAAVWFALNIILWIVVEGTLALFGWSLGIGVVYFVGFFAYLSHRER